MARISSSMGVRWCFRGKALEEEGFRGRGLDPGSWDGFEGFANAALSWCRPCCVALEAGRRMGVQVGLP